MNCKTDVLNASNVNSLFGTMNVDLGSIDFDYMNTMFFVWRKYIREKSQDMNDFREHFPDRTINDLKLMIVRLKGYGMHRVGNETDAIYRLKKMKESEEKQVAHGDNGSKLLKKFKTEIPLTLDILDNPIPFEYHPDEDRPSIIERHITRNRRLIRKLIKSQANMTEKTMEELIQSFSNEFLTRGIRKLMLAQRDKKCLGCGKQIMSISIDRATQDNKLVINSYFQDENGEKMLMTVDHIIPYSVSKNDSIKNIQAMCYVCNNQKGSLYNG